MFSQEIIDAIVAAANAHGWPASALLAVVECETSGKPFEEDNRTPTLLFERHKFYSELQAHQPGKLKVGHRRRPRDPEVEPKTQYKDQGTSASRLCDRQGSADRRGSRQQSGVLGPWPDHGLQR
jgi:hypothetical protein